GTDLAEVIVSARPPGGYDGFDELMLAAQDSGARPITAAQAEALAVAGALDGVGGSGRETADGADPSTADGADRESGDGADRESGSGVRPASRRRALWAAGAATAIRTGMLPGAVTGVTDALDTAPMLPGLSDAELTVADIWATGISPEHHPVEFS